MEEFKVDAESAKRDFDEIVEAYDLLMGDEDEDDNLARKRILRAIQRGVVYKNDAGFIVMVSESMGGKELKFSPLVGAVVKNADQSQSGGELSQALRILAAMTGVPVSQWIKTAETPRHGEEFKIAQAIAGLLAK